MILSRARLLSSHPLQALLELDKANREGAPVVVMTADPRLDPQLQASSDEDGAVAPEDSKALDEAAFALVEERRGETRLIGPASAGIAVGNGPVLLISTLGERFRPLVARLGAELGLAVDVGLGWDLSPAELIALALAESPQLERVMLALPVEPQRRPEEPLPAIWRGLSQALALLPAHVEAIAVSLDPDARAALATHGVEVVSNLEALVAWANAASMRAGDCSAGPERATAGADSASRASPPPTRVALVSALDGATRLIEDLVRATRLTLAEPRPETLDALRSELPRKSRLSGHIKIPRPTRRHLEVASGLLAADPEVDAVWLASTPEQDPFEQACGFGSAPPPEPVAARPRRGSWVETPDEDPRTHAHLMALRLMRRGVDGALGLGRDDLAAILSPWLRATPALPVSSLAAALDAALRLGFPVALLPSGSSGAGVPGEAARIGALSDKAALTAAWESLVASLQREEAPSSPDDGHERRGRMGEDPWRTRLVVAHRGAMTTVDYRSLPLPTWRHASEWLPIPVRIADLDAVRSQTTASLEPLARALGALAAHHPELTALTVLLDAGGQLVDARGTMLALDERP